MDLKEQRIAAKQFLQDWQDRGYEKGETAQFWGDLLHRILGVKDTYSMIRYEVPALNGGFMDGYIKDKGVIIEQKGRTVDLDKPEMRQGVLKSPFEQARDYAESFPPSQQPRYIVVCNFRTFRVHDREAASRPNQAKTYLEFTLEELVDNPNYLGFITDTGNSRTVKEREASIKAGEMIGTLYDAFLEHYDESNADDMHALNVLCVRLVFCLFAEDAGLFPKDSIYNYLKDIPPAQIGPAIDRLFVALDTEKDKRNRFDTDLAWAPYVNGGLFSERVPVPPFNASLKKLLLDELSADTDWSNISPTIFGGIFESTLNPVTRRQGGMHYTSPENIHKVIDPLFLDDLKDELRSIIEKDTTPNKQKLLLERFHEKISTLDFLDPACGSGNFLTETYLCLRELEDDCMNAITSIDRRLSPGQIAMIFDVTDPGKHVSLNQFHGIEINDFACRVAKTALWIAKLQADSDGLALELEEAFPLHEVANIRHENALRVDWNDVVPAEECNFIIGNPPFYGGMFMNDEQKAEMKDAFNGLKGVGELDYVTAWYAKSVEYAKGTNIKCCFVSTNSICQGLPVGIFWKHIKETCSFEIDYAYRTFVWGNEATDQAHVHVVIVGFSEKRAAGKEKLLFAADGGVTSCEHINGYLMPADDVYVTEVSNPLCDVPQMRFGSMPRTKGFTLTAEERECFIKENPLCEKWIRPYWGAEEFLNRKERYCLWLVGVEQNEIAQCPLVVQRIKQVRAERLASKAAGTRKFAETPTLFAQIAQPEGDGSYLLVPRVSSERRDYIPIAFVSNNVIASDLAYLVPSASMYHFGVMSSQFHNAWVRMVAGRMKSDYRYAKDLVYNTFIWPSPTSNQRAVIEACVQAVLDARDNHRDKKIGDIYKRDEMPLDLVAAHKALDAAVEAAYGVDFQGDEEKIVAHLFKLYAEATKDEK